MRIAYIVPTCSVSGGMAVICQHVNRLRSRGHTTMMISTVDVQPMSWFPNQEVPVLSLADIPDDLDVLVATSWATAFLLPKIKSKVKCYFVQSDETRFHPENSRWQHLTALTYYFGVNYLTEARWIKAWLKENFGHVAEIVPNGLDFDIFHQTTPFEPRGKRPRILLEGAIALPYKGMREAFEAVKYIDAEIWCVSSSGVPDSNWRCDRFFEHVPMQDMRRIYSSCDILLKLSRVEGFFGPPMEMMACGGVSVVGRVTGYDEYIVDRYNALVVDPLDIKAAESAVQSLIDSPDLRDKIISAGLDTAKSWKWDPSIDILEAYYMRLLKDEASNVTVKRATQYDVSLSYVYDVLSKNILAEDIVSLNGNVVIAPHVQKLAAFVAGTVPFVFIANLIRLLNRGYKVLKRHL